MSSYAPKTPGIGKLIQTRRALGFASYASDLWWQRSDEQRTTGCRTFPRSESTRGRALQQATRHRGGHGAGCVCRSFPAGKPRCIFDEVVRRGAGLLSHDIASRCLADARALTSIAAIAEGRRRSTKRHAHYAMRKNLRHRKAEAKVHAICGCA